MVTSAAGFEVVRIQDAQQLRAALMLLDRAGRLAGVPLLDEAEAQRLAAWQQDGQRPTGWRGVLVRRDDEVLAYGAASTTPGERSATGDAAIARSPRSLPAGGELPAAQEITAAILEAVREATAELEVTHLQVWMRAVGPAEIEAAATVGYELERRLAVLGRTLPVDDPTGLAALERLTAGGTVVRAFVPEQDDQEVVAVLVAAYAGTDDGGWDLARFVERRGWSWFRPEDLLVAEDPDGRLAGIHWLKRRGDGVGEVYNLAVHPRAQGRGVGPALLRAGLDHLAVVGCREVILWVDRANERAVSLYGRQGFVTRWEDVAVGTAVTTR